LDLDHPLRLIEPDELATQFGDDPRHALSFSASDFEDASRLDLRDPFEREVSRVVAFALCVNSLARSEIRVLLANEGRIIEVHH
jgi:hypothetical protein